LFHYNAILRYMGEKHADGQMGIVKKASNYKMKTINCNSKWR